MPFLRICCILSPPRLEDILSHPSPSRRTAQIPELWSGHHVLVTAYSYTTVVFSLLIFHSACNRAWRLRSSNIHLYVFISARLYSPRPLSGHDVMAGARYWSASRDFSNTSTRSGAESLTSPGTAKGPRLLSPSDRYNQPTPFFYPFHGRNISLWNRKFLRRNI